MAKALYRKYRSKTLDEIVGQEHITTALSNAVKTGRISHAYLFTGPRGVGKTSIARIYAHTINDLPYTDESNHIDIVEIDAASNRRIDEIRDLRDRVYIAPTQAKYKVYIIDEVHMLTKEAFNALLKTLEEPPAHVVFILATTEAQKLPATIVSRTQRYIFRPIDKHKVIDHLKAIAKAEKIKISDQALELIAEYGEGSFRDSISLLDQVGNHEGKVELSTVQKTIGLISNDAVNNILEAVKSGDKPVIISQLSTLLDQGYNASQLAAQINKTLRQSVTDDSPILGDDITLELMSWLIEVPASAIPNNALEIALLKSASGNKPKSNNDLAQPIIKATPVQEVPKVIEQPIKRSDVKPSPAVIDRINEDSVIFDPNDWPKVLETLKAKHNTLYSVAKLAQVSLNDEGKLELRLSFAFHQKRLTEVKNSQIIKSIMSDIAGGSVSFDCLVGQTKVKIISEDKPISTVSNIFGGGEVLS